MVARLKKAFEKANKLPAAAQEQLAEQLLEEIEGETKWDDTLAASQPLLDRLAKQALDAKRGGTTKAGGFDQL
jgi:hypothetical protein